MCNVKYVIMMKPNNPFLVYSYHSPAYFCDRETETQKIISALNNERNLTLIAPRRMGKTGLIKNVFHNMAEQEKKYSAFIWTSTLPVTSWKHPVA